MPPAAGRAIPSREGSGECSTTHAQTFRLSILRVMYSCTGGPPDYYYCVWHFVGRCNENLHDLESFPFVLHVYPESWQPTPRKTLRCTARCIDPRHSRLVKHTHLCSTYPRLRIDDSVRAAQPRTIWGKSSMETCTTRSSQAPRATPWSRSTCSGKTRVATPR